MQRRTLVRAADLAAFRDALCQLALDGDPLSARRRAVIVPTRASAQLLRRTIEAHARRAGRPGVLLPDLVTRDEWLLGLHQANPAVRPPLTRAEREILLARAARAARGRGWLPGAPFELRPGLLAAMLDLYDELRRRQRGVRRFAHAIFDQLRGERGTDRGTDDLIRQTCFLAFAFLGYERAVAASGGTDEHGLRRALIGGAPAGYDHVVVAVGDHPSDPRGLWPADFDLLGRLAIDRIDVVVTDEMHDAGFRDRIERELPGIDETRSRLARPAPVLVRPPHDASSRDSGPPPLNWLSRDREDELRDVVRLIRDRLDSDVPAGSTGRMAASDSAIVVHRPLPYLYLGRHVLADARLPYVSFDALPLAGEPYAALLDLTLAVARTGGTREAAVALLRSRLLRFDVAGTRVGLRDAAALDAVLAERRSTGEADTYTGEVDAFFGSRTTRSRIDRARALRGAAAAAAAREALRPFRDATEASAQVRALAEFLRSHESPLGGAALRDRHLRARAAVLGVLDGLARAFARHDDAGRTPAELAAQIHHAVESHTFSPRRGRSGVHLVDAVAARFGEFADVHLVGLVETDWPERTRRSIFYTSGLLKALGWPQEADHLGAQQAAFRDLLRLPSRAVHLHAFQLEGDAVVAGSPMIEAARDLAGEESATPPARRIFDDERLAIGSPLTAGLDDDRRAWLTLRLERPPLDDPRYAGRVPRQAPQAYRVSRVDRFVDCPFKYFAESVLGLPEEREEIAGLTPLERGTLVHTLFERFYREWHAEGLRTITPALLPEALERFQRLAREALASLPEADRVLEETRLLGSIVARGLAERVFELEADAGGTIADRLIEVELRGTFTFPELHGFARREIAIRGKADRVDVYAGGALRVVDYKLGRLPDVDRSIQIGVYAQAAQQQLEARDGRSHPVQAAMYLAFGDDRRLEGPLGRTPDEVAYAVMARASDFATAVAQIEAGQFPARPHRAIECQYCRYAGVCRKEYDQPESTSSQADEEADAAAESV
jgi:RecB family exonuclease